EEGRRQPSALDAGAASHAADLLAPEDRDRAAAGALDRLDRGDHPERSVELPAPRDAVQMRPRPSLRGISGASERVPGRIDLDVESCFLEPPAGEPVCLVLLRRVADAVRAGT